jgi:hypothetical protein
VLIVDEASRVRNELWATISPMLAAAPAAQQILLSTPAGASGEFHRAWTSGEDWERVQITADQCRAFLLSISPPSASASAMLSTARSISAPSSQRRAAYSTPRSWHIMFGDHSDEELDEPAPLVQGRIADRFLQ